MPPICNGAKRASRYLPASPQWGEFSLIIPNASTQGPPTSSAVRVNQGSSGADHRRFPATELEARPHLALGIFCGIAMAGASDKVSAAWVRHNQRHINAIHCPKFFVRGTRFFPVPRRGGNHSGFLPGMSCFGIWTVGFIASCFGGKGGFDSMGSLGI